MTRACRCGTTWTRLTTDAEAHTRKVCRWRCMKCKRTVSQRLRMSQHERDRLHERRVSQLRKLIIAASQPHSTVPGDDA